MSKGFGFKDVSGRRYGLPRDLPLNAGAVAVGDRGQFYRSFLFLDSQSQPAGHAVGYLTAGGTATAVTINSAAAVSTAVISASDAMPFIATLTSASDTKSFAGILAEDKIGPGMYWVQVGGPVTITYASSTTTSAVAAGVAMIATAGATQTTNLTNARGSAGGITVTAPNWTSQVAVSATISNQQFQGLFTPQPPGVFNQVAFTQQTTATITRPHFLAGPDIHRQVGNV